VLEVPTLYETIECDPVSSSLVYRKRTRTFLVWFTAHEAELIEEKARALGWSASELISDFCRGQGV